MSPGRLARPVASRGVMSKNQKKTPGSTVVKSSGCQKTGSSEGPSLGCGKCRYSARGCARCKAKAALAAGGMAIASTGRKNQKKKVEPNATKTKASPTAARGKSDGGLGCGKCRFSKRGCARCKARIGEGLIAGTKAQKAAIVANKASREVAPPPEKKPQRDRNLKRKNVMSSGSPNKRAKRRDPAPLHPRGCPRPPSLSAGGGWGATAGLPQDSPPLLVEEAPRPGALLLQALQVCQARAGSDEAHEPVPRNRG